MLTVPLISSDLMGREDDQEDDQVEEQKKILVRSWSKRHEGVEGGKALADSAQVREKPQEPARTGGSMSIVTVPYSLKEDLVPGQEALEDATQVQRDSWFLVVPEQHLMNDFLDCWFLALAGGCRKTKLIPVVALDDSAQVIHFKPVLCEEDGWLCTVRSRAGCWRGLPGRREEEECTLVQ